MSVLIVGATRGLGASLVKQYAQQGKTTYATTRSTSSPSSPDFPDGIKWQTGIDLTDSEVGSELIGSLKQSFAERLDTVVCWSHHSHIASVSVY